MVESTIGLFNLKPAKGSRHKRKLLGRGRSTGHGGSSTRGGKGQTARSGEGPRIGFEGGQMPLSRRIPKRGFSNHDFAITYEYVTLADLERKFQPNETVSAQTLADRGLVRLPTKVKILAKGELTKPLVVKVSKITNNAQQKILALGGKIE